MANTIQVSAGNRPARYQIRLAGKIRENWSDWFSGMVISSEKDNLEFPITTLVGWVPDQAALRGILCKLWDLNLTIISISRVEMDAGDKENEKDE